MALNLREAVVVITGASSGIGKAAALAFAAKGSTVVLTARNEDALEDTLEQCERAGGRGMIIPAEIADLTEVRALADRVIEAYGRIDVWINNAAVTLFGRIEETPHEDYWKVIETNLGGYVNGAREAIRQFRAQGEGRLINVSSVVGLIGQPYTSAYVASKWGIRGLTECLRMEVADAPDIHVSSVLPPTVDTPIFQHAANYTGREPKAMPPIYRPERVARVILSVARRPRKEVLVGSVSHRMRLMHALARGRAEKMMGEKVESDHFTGRNSQPNSQGTLHRSNHPMMSVSGEWRKFERQRRREERRVPRALWLGAAALPVALLFAARAR